MPTYSISFWNVENLFDVATAPEARRPEWLKRKLKSDLKGWTAAVLNQKIKQLATVIKQMNGGGGPDVLGVCEIENKHVLDLLVAALAPLGRTYKVAHADTKDKRGIDVAFIYDNGLFEKKEQFSHALLKRAATRDIFQVTLKVRASQRELILVGNHWPARMGGQWATEPYRMMAGETLAYFHERIQEIKGKDAFVLAMGDFNDEPFDRSLMTYALSTRQARKVTGATSPRFLNLMWPLMDGSHATHYFGSIPNMLDQFLASRGLVKKGADIAVVPGSVHIEQPAGMVGTGKYPAPVRFGMPSKKVNLNGFSDHYPISVTLKEKD